MKKFLKVLTGKAGQGENHAGDKDASAFYDALALDVLARTLWGEARGEGTYGMEAVAAVILNRVRIAEGKGGHWWGDNVIAVCQKPYQFSCWNRGDANYKKLQAVDESNLFFATALRIARRGIANALPDPTGGATHYHARTVKPFWAEGQVPTAIIGNHIFYQLIEG